MTKEPEDRMSGAPDGDDAADAEVHSITSAAPGHSVDMHQRMVRYGVAMGIRMVCIIAIFFLDGWFKLIAVAGAVFLPWVAVVIANAQTKADTYDSELLDHLSYDQLGTGYLELDGDWDGETIQGETLSGDGETTEEHEHRESPTKGHKPEEGAA